MAYQLWTPQEETLLRQLVTDGKHSYRDMEQFFPGRKMTGITSHARQCLDINNNIYRPHKYAYDVDFFREPNPLNSYIAGFLAADGSIATPANASPTLRLEISTLDTEHLKMIKKALGYTGVIASGGRGVDTVLFKITISEDYMDDLALNFGVIPRKTHHLSPPSLKTLETRVAFLAGLLDGDGCVSIGGLNSLSVSYVSASVSAVEWYLDTVQSLSLPSLRERRFPHICKLNYANAYRLAFTGAKAVALVETMQALKRQLGVPILDRKWDNPRLNQYINDFRSRFPAYVYVLPLFAR